MSPISQFVNSFGMHDLKISTALSQDGYVQIVRFRIITAEAMEVLREYLLFAS